MPGEIAQVEGPFGRVSLDYASAGRGYVVQWSATARGISANRRMWRVCQAPHTAWALFHALADGARHGWGKDRERRPYERQRTSVQPSTGSGLTANQKAKEARSLWAGASLETIERIAVPADR